MAKRLYVVGLGPGDPRYFTGQARAALEDAQVLCGYTVYVDLVSGLFPDKETFTTPMRGEVERCRWALETADSGRTVALVCSGDAGVYGMAGPALQLAAQWPDVEIEVVAGVTAALSGGAVLGAPLTHDFAVISLSDRLTAWETIEKRLEAAASADLSIVLYNPASKGRLDYLRRACEILLRQLPEDRPCGVARSIGREGESRTVLPLGQLRDFAADMFCTVFIGSSQTRVIGGALVTPRGYRDV